MCHTRKFLLLAVTLLMVLSCNHTDNPSHTTGGNTDEDTSGIPDKEGMNVKGKVTDENGKALSGIVISDGVQCVQTDEDGIYHMKSDMNASRFVFPIAPSEYELTFADNMMYNRYKALSKYSKVNVGSFTLKRRRGSADNYTVLFLGDPQVMSSRPHSVESWKYVTSALAEYKTGASGKVYQIMLGDMVVNEIEVAGKANEFLKTLKTGGIPSFATIGNHDHVQNAVKYYTSVAKYCDYFGPYNYAVNIGDVHYIFFDSCDWNDTGVSTDDKQYSQNLTDDGYEFLKSELAFVPNDKPVVVCTHCPLTRKQGGHYPTASAKHQDDLMGVLAGRDVSFWYGHLHTTYFWSYSSSQINNRAKGLKSVESHVVGRCGGCWACSGEVCLDGLPRGAVEMKVNGKQLQWRYISFDEKYPSDFNVLVPGKYENGKAMYCNVYLWDDKWGLPEMWVDGSKVGTMEHCSPVSDPWYSHFYPIWKSQNIEGFKNEAPSDAPNDHLFKIVPPDGTFKAEIRVKDRWGNTIKQEVEW